MARAARLVAAASLVCAACAAAAPDPREVSSRAAAAYFATFNASSRMQTVENYGPSIAHMALYSVAREFAQPQWAPLLDALLDAAAHTPGRTTYSILNNISVPWGYSIGDTAGLFPISYLARAEFHNESFAGFSENWQIVMNTARTYVLGWPERLADGTISRAAGWAGQPANNLSTFLWSDDEFMGIALLARAARNPGLPPALALEFANYVASQQVSFAAHMQDPADGLFFHGYNAFTNETSCCKWGRANGWVMMAHAEVASTLAAVAPQHPLLPRIEAIWRAHAAGMAATQAAGDGRFHQVLNESSTFLETSVTAMAVYSLADGVVSGVLDRATFAPVIEAAWAGAAAQVQADGTVTGICEGTGVGTDVAFYEARSTAYGVSDPGIGSVWRAALAYDRFTRAAASK